MRNIIKFKNILNSFHTIKTRTRLEEFLWIKKRKRRKENKDMGKGKLIKLVFCVLRFACMSSANFFQWKISQKYFSENNKKKNKRKIVQVPNLPALRGRGALLSNTSTHLPRGCIAVHHQAAPPKWIENMFISTTITIHSRQIFRWEKREKF